MVLLSFDTEEFDVPRENGVTWDTLTEGMDVSRYGTNVILDILRDNDVRATFFCTGNFAMQAPEVIRRIVNEGHEVACHGVDHWEPKPSDVRQSKEIVERISGQRVIGYRQPRMFAVDDNEIEKQGYLYNSSLNPAFIPGHYMHLDAPRTCFCKGEVLQIPASVTPWLRIPLFWLALHTFPKWIYYYFANKVLKKDGYFATYFHPWEFYPLKQHPEFKTKWMVRNNCGVLLAQRLDWLIKRLKEEDEAFITYGEFARQWKLRSAVY